MRANFRQEACFLPETQIPFGDRTRSRPSLSSSGELHAPPNPMLLLLTPCSLLHVSYAIIILYCIWQIHSWLYSLFPKASSSNSPSSQSCLLWSLSLVSKLPFQVQVTQSPSFRKTTLRSGTSYSSSPGTSYSRPPLSGDT